MTDKLPKKPGVSDKATSSDENERPTMSPPFDFEKFAREATVPSDPDGRSHSERITLTNEVELELARAQSALGSDPPRTRSAGALSIANARTRSTGPPSAGSKPSLQVAARERIASSPAPEITERTIDDPVGEMRERLSLGDYTGALEMSDAILAGDPENQQAAECARTCRVVLQKMYTARLGPLERVPVVIVPGTQMRWLSIDHRAGFILSLIDGVSTLEMILDVCGMPRLDALQILHELVQQRAVSFR